MQDSKPIAMHADPASTGHARDASSCPVCRERRLHELKGTYCERALLCGRCGHTFVPDLPSDQELARVYASYGYDTEAAAPTFLDGILAELVSSFGPYRREGRLLDVGFGAGGLLRTARDAGWNTFGVELSPAAVRRGLARSLGALYEGSFLEHPSEGNFDVIVMSELVEHLVDPMPYLRRAAELLRPGGLLYATTPHGRGLSGRLLGASWSVLRPPEHLQLFSIASLRASLQRAGFSRPRVFARGLLPHELLDKARSVLRPRTNATASAGGSPGAPPGALGPGEGRVERSYRLNEALRSSAVGRTAKKTANAVLRATALGDSLCVMAER